MISRPIPKLAQYSRRQPQTWLTGCLSRSMVFGICFVFCCCFYFQFLYQDPTATSAVHLSSSVLTTLAAVNLEVLNDSSKATVMAMATGYHLMDNKRFIGSLRKTGFTGKIILAVKPDIDPAVREYLTKQGVTMKFLNTVECTYTNKDVNPDNSHSKEILSCVDPYPDLKQRWSRFPLLRDFLEECKECTGPVLVTDFRDTFFQRDPFGDGAPAVSGLEVFEEHSSQKTSHWIVSEPVKKCKNITFDGTMLCSGTTVGTREAMLQYLSTMHAEMKEWMLDTKCCCNSINGDDQSIHNYLFYTGKLPFATSFPNRLGRVNTPGVQGSNVWNEHINMYKSLGYSESESRKFPYAGADANGSSTGTWIGMGYGVTDEKGYLTNLDGSRSRVVHQFDRFRWPLERWVDKNIGD